MDITLPKREPRTDAQKVETAIEYGFNAFIKGLKDQGVVTIPVMGLVYLPDQHATQAYKEASRAVYECLKLPAQGKAVE